MTLPGIYCIIYGKRKLILPRYDTNEGTGEIFLATLKMVANRANVSVMTVSRVLNDPQCVSDKTKERVLQAIAELN